MRFGFRRSFWNILFAFLMAVATIAFPMAGRSQGLLPEDVRNAHLRVTAEGHESANLRFGDLVSRVWLSENDATGPVDATFAAGPAATCAGIAVCTSVTLRFERDVNFRSFPSFSFIVPVSQISERPYRLLFTDLDRVNAPLFELLRDPLSTPSASTRTLWFAGGFFTPFHAIAGHTYTIVLTQSAPTMVRLGGTAKQSVTEAPIGANGVAANLLSAAPPVAMVADDSANKSSYTLRITGPDSMWSRYRATFLVPLSHAFVAPTYAVRIDRREPVSGSLTHLVTLTAQRTGDLLSVDGTIPRSGTGTVREYVVTLTPTTTLAQPSGEPPIMAVVGDSRSVLTILPQNPIGCNASGGPMFCKYSGDERLSYPGVVSEITGVKVVNLSMMDGSRTTLETKRGDVTVAPWLISEVPRVPANAAYVIVEAGLQDLVLGKGDPQTTSHLGILAAAIHARAPNAKLIFLGVFNGSGPEVDAWNGAAQALAQKYGGYVAPPSLSPGDTPDGIHANAATNRRIGFAVAVVLEALAK